MTWQIGRQRSREIRGLVLYDRRFMLRCGFKSLFPRRFQNAVRPTADSTLIQEIGASPRIAAAEFRFWALALI